MRAARPWVRGGLVCEEFSVHERSPESKQSNKGESPTMPNMTIQAPADAEAEVHTAARAFGAALKNSREFATLAAAERAISEDPAANAAIAAFEGLQQQFRAEITMGVLQDSQRAELEQCQQDMYDVPSIAAYVTATDEFQAVCRATASVVSEQIGIDFAANSRSGGCCG